MKNSSDTIGILTCDLPARNAVPQPTLPPQASLANRKQRAILERGFRQQYTNTIANKVAPGMLINASVIL